MSRRVDDFHEPTLAEEISKGIRPKNQSEDPDKKQGLWTNIRETLDRLVFLIMLKNAENERNKIKPQKKAEK